MKIFAIKTGTSPYTTKGNDMCSVAPCGRRKDFLLNSKIKQAAEIIKRSKFLVALTGAGISTNAGIPDFRGKNGIYTTGKYSPDVFSIDTFLKNPGVFYEYARDYIELKEKIKPTFTHYYLSELENSSKLKHILTQNIDGLHQKAGSKKVVELHGGYSKSYCISCLKEYNYVELKEKIKKESVPRCESCKGLIKPDIIFFGENVRCFEQAKQLVSQSDVFLVIGSSMLVYPVAFLPGIAKGGIIIVNKGGAGSTNPQALLISSDIDEFFKNISKYL